MINYKLKVNSDIKSDIIVKPFTEKSSKHLIGIKTNRVYSQIARMGRNPNKHAERALLISALDNASIKIQINGKIVKKDPPFVPMNVDDIKLCFGKQFDKIPKTSFVNLPK